MTYQWIKGITTSGGLRVGGDKKKYLGSFNLINTTINTHVNSPTTKEIYSKIHFQKTDEFIQTIIAISQNISEIEAHIGFNNRSKDLIHTCLLNLSDPKYLEAKIALSVEDQLTIMAVLELIEKYQVFIKDIDINVIERYKKVIGHAYSLDYQPDSISGSLEAIDIFGPRISGLTPSSGSTYNNPLTTIEFNIYDREKTSINPASIDIRINDLLVIQSGIDVTPALSGNTGFVEVNDYTYNFYHQTSNPYNPDSVITVSGKAMDMYTPANSSNFNYSFRVWKTNDLEGEIFGLADVESPYLINLSPSKYQSEVAVDTNLVIEITDDHTGVDFSSVIITLNDLILVSGENTLNQDIFNTTPLITQSGRGIRYLIDPVYNFEFKSLINISVYAKDKFTGTLYDIWGNPYQATPNVLNDSYNFLTYDNTYLITSGLQIYTNNEWIDTVDLFSYEIAQSGVDFRIHYLNTEGTGIDLINSYITYNGIVVLGISYTEITPNFDYLVNFHLTPDYSDDCDLIYHVVKSGSVSGVNIYKDYHNELLWGAEICYDPDTNFKYSEDIPIFIQISDKGEYPKVETKFYKVTTAPQPKNDLYANIQGIDAIYQALEASIASNNPYFEYGKTMNMDLSIKDFAGNELNYIWSFKIEDK